MPPAIELHRQELRDLCRRVSVRRLDLFGSAARGTSDAVTSELDFLVKFEALPPGRYADAYFESKEGLKRLLGRPVDLLTAGSLQNPYFRECITTTRLSVYAAGQPEMPLGCVTRRRADSKIHHGQVI